MRLVLAISAAASVAACLERVAAPGAAGAMGSGAIQDENLRGGSPSWDAALWGNADTAISGYGLPTSLVAGDTLHLFVSATHAPVTILVYRLGWDRGVGARPLARPGARPAGPPGAVSPPGPAPHASPRPETHPSPSAPAPPPPLS